MKKRSLLIFPYLILFILLTATVIGCSEKDLDEVKVDKPESGYSRDGEFHLEQ